MPGKQKESEAGTNSRHWVYTISPPPSGKVSTAVHAHALCEAMTAAATHVTLNPKGIIHTIIFF